MSRRSDLNKSRCSVIEPESDKNITFTSSSTSLLLPPKHPYNTRLSSRRQANDAKELVVDLSKCRINLFASNSEVFEERIILPNQMVPNMILCAPTNNKGYGRLTKVALLLLTICVMGVTYRIMYDNNSESNSYSKLLRNELQGIKTQLDVMKQHTQYVLKTKQDTHQIIAQIDGMLQNLKKQPHVERTHCEQEIDKKYNAEKTERPDYALETAGAAIASVRLGEDYKGIVITLFGWRLCSATNGANRILQPNVSPGECWAFKGSEATVVIKLIQAIYITGVTLEHIPKSISPSEDTRSAPHQFSIYGLPTADTKHGINLGTNFYDIDGRTVQYFPAKSTQPFEYVEVRFESNHGEPDYTCVYRFRVHGNIKDPGA